MAYTRVLTVTAETGSTEEFIPLAGSGITVDVSDLSNSATKSRTGNRSMRFSGDAAIKLLGTLSGRGGFWFNHATPSPLSAQDEEDADFASFVETWEDVPAVGLRRSGHIGWNPGSGLLGGRTWDKTGGVYISSLGSNTVHRLGWAEADRWRYLSFHTEIIVDPEDGPQNWINLWIDGIALGTIRTYEELWFFGATYTGWQGHIYVDDFWYDTFVSEVSAQPPTKRFFPSFPTADGADIGWTASAGNRWACVDEVPANNDTDYIEAAAAAKNTFQAPDLSPALSNLYLIQAAVAMCRARSTGSETVRNILHDGASYANGASEVVATSYEQITDRFALDPSGAAWTEANYNTVAFGVEKV